MKKKTPLIILIIFLLLIGTCSNKSQEENTINEFSIDYESAEAFEEALNNDIDVTDKIVEFIVNDYKPDSILGINSTSGEHLNFISKDEIDVMAGDTIIGKVTKKPSKVLGSWKIPYEVISIIKDIPIITEETVIESTEPIPVPTLEEATVTETVPLESVVETTEAPEETIIEETVVEIVEPMSTVESTEESTKPSILEVHYIDVGQSDATLLICDDEAMLIDAGDDSKGTTVQLYLKKQGVTSLKYLILTHTDSDHIGGSDVIITKFDIENIFLSDFKKENNVYRDMMDAMEYKRYSFSMPSVGSEFTLGSASFTILAPNKTYDNPNDSSVALMLQHGDNKFLFSGDAQIDAENDILHTGIDISCDVFKAAHHGSKSSNGKNFIKAIKPTYVVISCGKDNSYGHPHQGPMDRFKYYDASIFRTDEQGTIIATSDGKNITWNHEPSTTWAYGTGSETTAGEAVASGSTTIEQIKENSTQNSSQSTPKEALQIQESPNQEQTPSIEEPPVANTSNARDYILNTNTKKFHYSDCGSVKKMKDKNKQAVTMNREEIIGMGYDPCGNCHP